jgi:hypothetical protein
MKSTRLLLIAALTLLVTGAFAQSDMHKLADPPALSDAQKSFEQLKTLAGTWTGPVTIDPPHPGWGDTPVQVTLRVTSRGNALVHEMRDPTVPDDPTKTDHPVTMLYLDGDHLTLVHYCDAGNRPRMVARQSADGKTTEFDFADLSGGNENGHMYHAAFTFIDANHHREDWTFLMPGDKPMHAHMDLQRTK